MSVSASSPSASEAPNGASWGAVLAMSLCVFVLIASEFMPVSLLTPIASDLMVSEGQAGQAIAMSGAFAVLTSLFISAAAGRLDRKHVLLGLTLLMALSGTIMALAPNFGTLLAARALIGVTIGGFWSLSAATVMRLVPEERVPRALAILNGGNALATIVAAPLGSFLGGLIGWRGAFFCIVPVAVIVFIWQLASMPSMRGQTRTHPGQVFLLLMRPVVLLGMAAVGLLFMGQFALFTYVRPFLETVTQVALPALSLILLVIGVSGFVGTILIGAILKDGLHRTLVTVPVLLAGIALALIAFGDDMIVTAVLLGLWGLIGTSAPVAWWTWLSRTLPQDAEAGGGLMVAVIQLAITLGATCGGLLYDWSGYQSAFQASAALLILGALLAFQTARMAIRVNRKRAATKPSKDPYRLLG